MDEVDLNESDSIKKKINMIVMNILAASSVNGITNNFTKKQFVIIRTICLIAF